ncbi:glucose-1-phosphate cytidylyltransferase [Gammaproteobacteria bacterium]|nr:glucose-1-phosphate cytidylyltransferase [Gammaproteobacteria bacterium]
MKAVILAGGFGTRISEETDLKPKPMIEIGGMPILWHIMKNYSFHGVNDFIICCGYKGYVIKEYFANYFLHRSDITFDMKENSMQVHQEYAEPWRVTLIDTGQTTMTGGRLKRIKPYINDNENFCFTYGDGLSDINIKNLINFHLSHGKKATLSSVIPSARFGVLEIKKNVVNKFIEKPKDNSSRINAGFFVLSSSVIDYIDDDNTVWEKAPLEKLAKNGDLMSYNHDGFWHPMDTLRDKILLENMWNSNSAPWKVWK